MAEQKIDTQSWMLLLVLSVIWGGSFMFIGVAVKELPALLIVLARVGIAAAILIPVHLVVQGKLPRDAKTWLACGGMSIMNNVIPFTAISWGQHHITGGLASVINATTPMFAALFMALSGLEGITPRKAIALGLGLVGVLVLKGGDFGDLGAQTLGILSVVLASACYGLSTPWSKVRLTGIPPLTTATLQLTMSSIVMAAIVLLFAEPAQYAAASSKTWISLVLLAAVSTSIAYLIFFRIIARAGPSFVSLVTMVIPVSAILMGYVVLNELLTINEVIGALIIGLALVIIDGRALRYIGIMGTKSRPR
ncbi:MAG: DMT family transporter [Phyllobacteriaceae bacterium]|nr:DMT family transporter [Phyllobacteriaceae bacterium]